MMIKDTDIIEFWFEEITPQDWFKKDLSFDDMIMSRFSDVHTAATRGELFGWRATSLGRLAEIIVLDQFSRNIYRDKPEAFAFDGMALVLAQEAVARHAHQSLLPAQQAFLFMPYMHSESKYVHELAVELFTDANLKDNLKYELAHKDIIDKFGRYPHRNTILGRESTVEEKQFLAGPGSSF